MLVEFKLRGLTALLMHADDVEQADLLTEWRQDPDNKGVSKAGDDRSPAWTWQTYLYRSEEGKIAWPSANLMVCLRQAATQIVMKKQKTFKEASQAGIWPSKEYFSFLCQGKEIGMDKIQAMTDLPFAQQVQRCRDLGFTLFTKRARVGTSKHVRVRPRFDNWSVVGTLEVQDSIPELTTQVIEQFFTLAGRIGLGDWRTGCKTPGPYGRFISELKFK